MLGGGKTLAALAISLTGGLAIPQHAAAVVTLAHTGGPFEGVRVAVDADGSTLAFSLYDAASATYSLAVVRGTGAVERLAATPQAEPFDLDVGPGPNGVQTLVYSRCAKPAPPAPSGCDLFRYPLVPGGTETPITAANGPGEEYAPTVYGDRIVFARARSRFPTAEIPRVYTRSLTGTAQERSRRLAGVPARECAAGRCVKTTYGRVDELELGSGGRLAEVVEAGPGTGENATVEVRLARLSGASGVVARTIPGAISVRKTFLGLSFERHELSFARILYYGGDTLFRYRTDRGGYRSAVLGRDTYGLAARGGGRYSILRRCGACVPLPGSMPGAPGPIPLELVASSPFAFDAARAPIKPRGRSIR